MSIKPLALLLERSAPDVSMGHQPIEPRPRLLTLDNALNMRNEDVAALFQEYINPKQYNLLRVLGFHKITISRADLASFAGTTGETLARIMTRFKNEKIIGTRGRKLFILKPEKLLELIE